VIYLILEVRQFATGLLDQPEGVAVGRDGTVYAAGEPGQVYRISPDGKHVQTIANTGGFFLGITLDREENVYICDRAQHAVYKVTPNGALSLFMDSCEGRASTSPNFKAFDSRGNLNLSASGIWRTANCIVFSAAAETEFTVHHRSTERDNRRFGNGELTRPTLTWAFNRRRHRSRRGRRGRRSNA
jgi:gluconolactonase